MEPMPQNNDQLLRETYRLTRENNELLHRARRSAFFWGFIKFLIYAALLLAPDLQHGRQDDGQRLRVIKAVPRFRAPR